MIHNPQQTTPPQRTARLRRLARRLLLAAGLLGVLLAIGLVACKYWLAPRLLRSQLDGLAQRYLAEGYRLHVEELDFDLTGPAVLHGLSCSKPGESQPAATAREVRLHLRDWPGLSPVLERIDILDPVVYPHLRDGRVRLPLKAPSTWPASSPSRFVDIQTVTFTGGSIRIRQAPDQQSNQPLLNLEPLRLDEKTLLNVGQIDLNLPEGIVLRNLTLTDHRNLNVATIDDIHLQLGPDGEGKTALQRITLQNADFTARVRDDRLDFPVRWNPTAKPRSETTASQPALPEILLRNASLTLQPAAQALDGDCMRIPALRYLHLPEEITANLEHLALGPDDPTVFRNVRLASPGRDPWATAEQLSIQLGDPSSQTPRVEVRLVKPHLKLHAREGIVLLPFRIPERTTTQPAQDPAETPTDRVILTDARLSLSELPPSETTTRPASAPADLPGVLGELRIHGSAEATGDLTITIGEHLSLNGNAAGSANLNNLRVENLRTLLGAEPLQDQTIQPLEVHSLQFRKVTLKGNVLSLPAFRARTCNGRLWGETRLSFTPGQALAYTGKLRVSKLDLETLLAAWDPSQQVQYGRGSAVLDYLVGRGTDLAALQTDAVIFLDDSDLDDVDLLEDILTFLQLKEPTSHTDSDLRLIVRLRDGVASIGQGSFGNPAGGILVQPGGTVNLLNGKLDLDIVAGNLSALRGIPLLGPLGDLAGNLTRLHVGGTIENPRLSKRPLRDLASGTTTFFRDLLNTGGELRGLLLPDDAPDEPTGDPDRPSVD